MKKSICLLLTLSLALCFLTVSYAQDADFDTLKASDVNADGVINILDLVLIASQFGVTPTADQTSNPDVNGDGTVNILDLTLVTRHLGKTVPPPVAFVSANPATDSQLAVDDTITLTFDNTPEDVTVSRGTATIAGKTVTVTGPFDPGPLALTIAWADGSQTLTYTINPPVAFVSANPASDSELDIDDTITLTFDNIPEDVTVSRGTAIIADKIVTISGPFAPGPLALTITWADGSQTLTYIIRQPAAFVSAYPVARSSLDVDDTITLTFDNIPEDVTVSRGTATIADKIVTITGPFDPGRLTLRITWADGTRRLTYTVIAPDTEAPEITSGTVSDGDEDVDPKAINTDARIKITFSEEVSGSIALQTAAGVDVGWLGKVDGTTGTLELVKDKELGNEINYVIAGKVSDAAGNETDLNIRFTTASKTSGIPFEVTDATFNTVVLGSTIPTVVEFKTDW